MIKNSKERFSNRVADYVRYRPSYPKQVVEFVHEQGVSPGALVADIGAGTGISAKLFLEAGHSVIAVEPNDAMRTACDEWLGAMPGYSSNSGSAEDTRLGEGSIDLVIAAQAFHWFDLAPTRREFARILRGNKMVALFWNSRLLDATPFLREYEQLLQQFGTDYAKVGEQHSDQEVVDKWFGGAVKTANFSNAQSLSLEALRGRLLSSSYAPKEDDSRHEPMLAALNALFARTNKDGMVEFLYETRVYVGSLV